MGSTNFHFGKILIDATLLRVHKEKNGCFIDKNGFLRIKMAF